MKSTEQQPPGGRERDIFLNALERAPGPEREAYLDVACAGDPELRRQVAALLSAHAQSGEFLRTAVTLPASERPGEVVGRYKLLEQIGEGGFGTVWMAEQQEPVRRRVALKIIKLGMDTRQVVARFEAERQALALMDHPNIAHVFDAGATETGRPYFVMELVRGVPLTTYCDTHQLPPRERLELFIQVCHAVQHAHQKGIIHRDLKPSNILVTVQDDRPVPKVIDFGVAKATAAPLTDKTLFTRFHQFVGTPAYMSPEQAGLGNADIDTRSDIYSLGVLLYELLTGRTPFDTQKLLQEGYEAMLRVIREGEPAKPSTRLSTLTVEELQQVARVRKTEPGRLGRLVRGDLDWIVMKALEKERGRRYGSAGDFTKDLQRYLTDQPVEASPPSTVYRARRFLWRNRLLVASGGSIVLILLLALPISLWLAWVATRERENAFRAQRQATTNAVEAQQRLVRIDVANGVRAMENHDAFAARVWFTEALRQEVPGSRAEKMHRYRLGAIEKTSPRLVQVWDHTAPVRFAAFSPDGQWALTAGSDHTVRLWNVHSGQPGPTLSHPTNITRAVFSGDSRKVLTVTYDAQVRIWDLASGQLAAPPLPHESDVSHALISRDGRRVFTVVNAKESIPGAPGRVPAGAGPGEVRVWDATTGQPVRSPLRNQQPIRELALSADDQWLAASLGSSAVIWNLRQGHALLLASNTCRQLPPVRQVDSKQSTAVESLWPDFPPPAKPRRRAESYEPEVVCLAFSPDSRQVLTVFGNSAGTIWSLLGGPSVAMQPAKSAGRKPTPSSPRAALFSPDGEHVLLADYSGAVRRWNARTGEWEGQLEKQADESFCLSPDGLFGWFKDRVCDLETGQLPSPPPLHWGCRGAAFSPDGLRLLTAGDDGLARIWDLAGRVPLPGPFRHDWAMVTRNRSTPEAPSEPTLDQQLKEQMLASRSKLRATCFSFDGTRVLTVSDNGSARVWNATTGAPLTPYITVDKPLACAAFSRDGARFAVGGGFIDNGVARVWDAATGAAVGSLLTYTSQVDSVEFSANGKWLLARRDLVATDLTDAETGQPVALLQRPGTVLYNAAFSPDGSLVAVSIGSSIPSGAVTEAGPNLVRRHYVWQTQLCEAGTWKPLATLTESNRVVQVHFSPDGRWLVLFTGNPFIEESYFSKANHRLSFRMWDAKTGRPVSPEWSFSAVPIKPQAVFSEDKRHFFLFDLNGNKLVWDLLSQQRLDAEQWRGLKRLNRGMSPDAQRVAADQENGLFLFDALTGDPLTPPLQADTGPRSFAPVRFSPDGQRLVAINGERAQLWNLPPDNRSIEDLVALAELLAGRHLDASGDFTSPPGPAITNTFARLRSKYPDTFAASSAQTRLWRENLAEACEQTGRSFGAIFHLECLTHENPNDENLRSRLARARTAAALSQVR
jgi:WD40 repeat protein/serine/threonine protein kinase